MEDKSRHVNFNKFVEERSVQIAKFLVDLELDTKKKGHQALPKSVRRRAMSHNRFRIPRRMRKGMEEDLAKAESMQKLPKCRKHIRKRRHLISAYKMRSQKVQWLSTHLWAARRMRMVNHYGYKVAFTPNNKSFRSAYRYTRHAATLADLSYLHVITLSQKDKTAAIPNFLKVQPDNEIPNCGRLYQGQIVDHNDTLISPCLVMRSQADEMTLRIFFHPAVVDQVRKLGTPTGWNAIMQQGQTDIYCLNGPQAFSLVEQALKSYGLLSKEGPLASCLYSKESPIVYFSLENNNYDLANKPLVDRPIPEEKLLVKGYDANSNTNIRAKMLAAFTAIQGSKMEPEVNQHEKAFWKMFEQGQNHDIENTTFRITLRSRYTHRRKNKLSKEQKKQAIRSQRQSSEERGRRRMKDESQGGDSSYQEKQIFVEEDPNKKKNACLEEVNPVLVAFYKGTLFVMASNANSCRLWRIMSRLNLKVVGRRQLNHYNLEQGIRTFPQDYAETAAFRAYQQEQKKINFKRYYRLPLPKRPNYLKLNSPSPFCTIVPTNPTFIELQMVSRGHCSTYSYICQLLPEDLQKVAAFLDSEHVGIVHSETGEGERKKYQSWEEFQNDLKQVKPSRKIIGSVTSGCYRYTHSRQGGIGFIDKSLLSSDYLDRFGGYLLVRRPSSPNYMLAQLITKITNKN